jgi:chromosomal replication initiator protein
VTLGAEPLQAAWPEIIGRLRTADSRRAAGIRLWLSDKVVPRELRDGILLLEVPTPLFKLQIRQHFDADLVRLAAAVLGVEVAQVQCRITRHTAECHRQRLADRVTTTVAEAPVAVRPVRGWGQGYKALQDFVVGGCNRIAYDATRRILEEPDNPVNPLFIHGSSGLGKTHLEQGLALAFKERNPNSKVQYMTCEQFRNAYLSAVESKALASLRVKLRHCDLLLIDDIHFLSRGQAEKTKEELFATFNDLDENGKKVVFTSDAHPSDIKYLEERFVQRFAGGLVVMLDRPDSAVRREVVATKARAHGAVLPSDVIDFLADHITDNFRELEGAVNKIVAYAASFDRTIDLAVARQALADILGGAGGEPRLKVILRAVADYFDLTAEDILGRGRSGPRSTARHIAMYLLKQSSNETYAGVAAAFGARSHSSVAYACEQVARYRATNPDLDGFIEELLPRLRRS